MGYRQLAGLLLVGLAFAFLGFRCSWPAPNPRCVHVPGECAEGMVLDWEGGRTAVRQDDCVELPNFYATRARLCCGELCSGVAEPCTVPLTCQRTITFRGEVLSETPEVFCP